MARILWTPEGSEMATGTVLMERPTKPLTMDEYRGNLSGMITRMVRRAGSRAKAQLLRVEYQEGLSVINDPMTAGDVMVFESEFLAERSGMMVPTWPIQPEQIKQDVDLTAEQMEERTLTEFLGILYRASS